jgi:molybdopterin molybdotransferase
MNRDRRSATPDPDWLSVFEARQRILEACRPLPIERLRIRDALGRALASDVASRVDHPPWDNSAMDGFAVHADDVEGASENEPVLLPVVDEVPAGAFPAGPLASRTAVRVMTGAPVPEGATGVIRIEHTDGGTGGKVAVRSDSDARRNIRARGEDLRRGEIRLRAGDEVTAAVVGSLAAMGWPEVEVFGRPRVAILSNGDELADFDELEEVLAGRRIMNSNEHTLASLLQWCGADAIRLGVAADDVADVRRRIAEAGEFDVLITSAGVSVGDHDVVKAALNSLGLEHGFWRVRMRPGSPVTFGTLAGRPVFGLPGNPVSVMVTFHQFVRPALRALAGHSRLRPMTIRARAGEEIVSPGGLTYFFRVRLQPSEEGAPLARLTGPQGSGILGSMVAADALAVVPEDRTTIAAGEELELIPLREWLP